MDLKQPLCCGRTFLSTGMIDRARHEANRLVTAIAPFAKLDIPIVGLEPSCTLALRDEIPALLNSKDAFAVANATLTFEELLARDKPKLSAEERECQSPSSWPLSPKGI